MDNEILNIQECAKFIGIHPVTLSKIAKANKIPAKKVGREWRFSKKALIEWLAQDPCTPIKRYA